MTLSVPLVNTNVRAKCWLDGYLDKETVRLQEKPKNKSKFGVFYRKVLSGEEFWTVGMPFTSVRFPIVLSHVMLNGVFPTVGILYRQNETSTNSNSSEGPEWWPVKSTLPSTAPTPPHFRTPRPPFLEVYSSQLMLKAISLHLDELTVCFVLSNGVGGV